jgi:hypothetical protein
LSKPFHLAQGLTAALQPGDVLHLRRNRRAALSLSVLRGGRLVVAVGALDDVPLGDDLAVRTARDYTEERAQRLLAGGTVRPGSDAERALYRDVHRELLRDMPGEQPVELRVDGRWHACPRGGTDLGAYAIHVVRGFDLRGMARDMCVAIARRGACPEDAAAASARLLALDPLVMDHWDEDP